MQEPVRSIHNRPEPRKSQRGGTCSGRWTTLAVPWQRISPPQFAFLNPAFPSPSHRPQAQKKTKIQIKTKQIRFNSKKSFRTESRTRTRMGMAQRFCPSAVQIDRMTRSQTRHHQLASPLTETPSDLETLFFGFRLTQTCGNHTEQSTCIHTL